MRVKPQSSSAHDWLWSRDHAAKGGSVFPRKGKRGKSKEEKLRTPEMNYHPVENLEVWRRAKDLAVATYKALESSRDYGLKDQMTRAAVSIPSNLAEGYERHSAAEKRQFYRIAKGSAAELRTQLVIATEIGIIAPDTGMRLVDEVREIGAMTQGLIRSLPE